VILKLAPSDTITMIGEKPQDKIQRAVSCH